MSESDPTRTCLDVDQLGSVPLRFRTPQHPSKDPLTKKRSPSHVGFGMPPKGEDRVMRNNKSQKNPETSTEPTNARLKRRDLLLSGRCVRSRTSRCH